MKFGSVCSGIEAASVAWGPLGWKAAWFSEIEPFPSAVLAHHYPSTPNLGDMTALPERIRSGEVEAPDVFCGGTPCQAFSVAGLRKSLDDARGNLSLTFCGIANAIDDVRRTRGDDECIVFWENVPGVLSTKDNAFGCFLAALAGCDSALIPLAKTGWTDSGLVAGPKRSVAWRILDAQYFGLAQRRKRVFVVASARERFDPAAVLFECDGVRRDFAPSREAWERVAPTIAGCSNGGGANVPGRDVDSVESLQPTWWDGGEVAATITTKSDDQRMPDKANAQLVMQPVTYDFFNITAPVNRQSRTPGDPCHTLARSNAEHAVLAFHPTQDPISSSDVCHAISSGNGQGCATAAVAFDAYNHTINGDINQTLRASTAPGNVQAIGGVLQATAAVAWAIGSHAGAADGEQTNRSHASGGPVGSNISEQCAYSLRGGRTQSVATPMQVRRLTPRECERLQGFPDDYTAIPWRGKTASDCPDGPRYKALGNSWAVPVVRWIGQRIAQNALAICARGEK